MIQGLLEAIAPLLHAGLFNSDPAREAQLLVGRISEEPPQALPLIALYPGLTTFSAKLRDAGTATVSTVREFQQRLLVDVFAQNAAEAERFASLSASTILTAQPALLAHFNATKPTNYTTAEVGSLHRLEQLQLLSATPTLTTSYCCWQLEFQLTGHMIFSQLNPDGAEIIQTILLKASQ